MAAAYVSTHAKVQHPEEEESKEEKVQDDEVAEGEDAGQGAERAKEEDEFDHLICDMPLHDLHTASEVPMEGDDRINVTREEEEEEEEE